MTNAFKRNKMRVPLRVHLRRAMRVWFMLLIIGLIPFFLWFLTQDLSMRRFTGVVESESETVGAVASARIVSIEVQPGQRVSPGDVLVRLDPADRVMDMAMQEARLADYEQSLMRYDQSLLQYRQTLQESERRCRQTVEEASVALEKEKMDRARDEAELAGLKAEIAHLQPLIDKRLVSEIELSSLRPKVQALEQTGAEYAPLLEALQKRHALAVKDLKEVQDLLASVERRAGNDPIKASMRQVTETYRQAAKNDPFVLRASRAGIVSRIQRQTGDVVTAGEPIVRVASVSSMYITGLLTQRQLTGLAVGDRIQVLPVTEDTRQAVAARVESVDPEVLDLLDPFNPSPRYPVRGRRVRLRVLDANSALLPGETVALQPVRQETWLESVRRYCSFSGCRPSAL